jgi:hypothetical protein
MHVYSAGVPRKYRLNQRGSINVTGLEDCWVKTDKSESDNITSSKTLS